MLLHLLAMCTAATMCETPAVGQRYYGGGYVSGSSADAVLPYPLTDVDAAYCARACSTDPACRTYVHVGTTCYRFAASEKAARMCMRRCMLTADMHAPACLCVTCTCPRTQLWVQFHAFESSSRPQSIDLPCRHTTAYEGSTPTEGITSGSCNTEKTAGRSAFEGGWQIKAGEVRIQTCSCPAA